MASSSLFVLCLMLVVILIGNSNAQLTPDYYANSCPNLLSIVKPIVQSAINKEARMGASLLRLHFHDCFVQGCDGSLLLDGTPTLQSEKTARPNNNSVRGFEVIDQIKLAIEKACPEIVSCADILAIVARDAVVSLGGPCWDVKLGRRDSTTANPTAALNNLIPPSANLTTLIAGFKSQGFTTRELVALYGAHTIGKARCINFRPHIYNDTNIDPSFAKQQQAICPRTVGQGDNNLAPFDAETPNKFDSTYYGGLIAKKTILHSDQEFFNGRATDVLVKKYSADQRAFFADFAAGMVKMGDLNPLTGSKGQIRKNCRKINYKC